MNKIAIIGASGYIGRHLVAELVRVGGSRVRVLTRQKAAGSTGFEWPSDVEVINGDMHDEASLLRFLEPNCTLINLAYLWNGGELANLTVIRNLLEACKVMRVKRLIHCSTAAVVGRVSGGHITENVECRPITEYGVTKLKIEQAIIHASEGVFDAAILRPTGVFGPGGEPLKKLSNDLVNGDRLKNYLKSCLFGTRRMNLVHVANVVAAILFLIRRSERIGGEIFIVSDDEKSNNNFLYIEQFLMRSLNCTNYPFPQILLPLDVLSLLLRLLRRNNINPRCNYSQEKLESIGFRSPVDFDDGLSEYAKWYRATYFAASGEMAK
ncbi:NAD-dependent epimerase/dehydratase family protein [Polaromonas jejuensis]|uniref:NAD-dependent epimerase/dehydratase family protein n=1 Tax=Polaromonas jejuensis TaxID=457502 RepID=A0ABW0Q7S3_9BURK|nr:NAD(P)-dependent oxidoreductase [Polaromonas jejuensis]